MEVAHAPVQPPRDPEDGSAAAGAASSPSTIANSATTDSVRDDRLLFENVTS
jgi:hypothetical protein